MEWFILAVISLFLTGNLILSGIVENDEIREELKNKESEQIHSEKNKESEKTDKLLTELIMKAGKEKGVI